MRPRPDGKRAVQRGAHQGVHIAVSGRGGDPLRHPLPAAPLQQRQHTRAQWSAGLGHQPRIGTVLEYVQRTGQRVTLCRTFWRIGPLLHVVQQAPAVRLLPAPGKAHGLESEVECDAVAVALGLGLGQGAIDVPKQRGRHAAAGMRPLLTVAAPVRAAPPRRGCRRCGQAVRR